jgi:hypothetical protein
VKALGDGGGVAKKALAEGAREARGEHLPLDAHLPSGDKSGQGRLSRARAGGGCGDGGWRALSSPTTTQRHCLVAGEGEEKEGEKKVIS